MQTLTNAQRKIREEIRKVKELLEKYDGEISKATDGKPYTDALFQLQNQ